MTAQPATQPAVTLRPILPPLPVPEVRELWGEPALVAWAEAHMRRDGAMQ
jgi:hypothetical protein